MVDTVSKQIPYGVLTQSGEIIAKQNAYAVINQPGAIAKQTVYGVLDQRGSSVTKQVAYAALFLIPVLVTNRRMSLM